ncbi:MAG: energy transducer TonB, partial [Verrucomicrobiota bacterium]|nr:energy transducer TonB [Verrucomicrobiota bacterium]
ARTSLSQWRHKPGPPSSGRMTMSFYSRLKPVTLDPLRKENMANVPVHPLPTYPFEARRKGWAGTALFVMRFRQDGSVEKVVALKSTGHPILDEEGIRTLQRWRCLPGVYFTAYIPVIFTMRR